MVTKVYHGYLCPIFKFYQQNIVRDYDMFFVLFNSYENDVSIIYVDKLYAYNFSHKSTPTELHPIKPSYRTNSE